MTRLISSLFVGMLLLLGSSIVTQAKALSLTEGKVLKNLKRYRLKDFHLKKRVKYFDLRQYYNKKGYPYMRGWAFDQKAYNKLPSNQKSLLKNRKASKTRNKKNNQWIGSLEWAGAVMEFRRYGQPYPKTISILYYIGADTDTGVSWRNSQSRIKDFLGDIDRPAELALILHAHRGVIRYKKISDGYLVRIDNLITEKNSPDGRCMHIVKHAVVEKQGEIVPIYGEESKEELLDKKKCAQLRKEIDAL